MDFCINLEEFELLYRVLVVNIESFQENVFYYLPTLSKKYS